MPSADPAAGLPSSLAGFEDHAIFVLFVNEEKLGRLESVWKLDGSFEGRSTVTYAGQTVETTVRIVPDPDGRWQRISVESPLGVRTLTREGSAAQRTFKDKTSTLETPEGALLFENEAPALISQALRLYDRSRGGEQNFPLLIGGAVLAELDLEATGEALRTVNGRDIALTQFCYGVPGLDLHVSAGEDRRVYFVDVPAQRAAFVREGYEALRKPAVDDPLLSAPRFEVVVERNINIPMRDGIQLSTDIYRPQGLEKAPVVLVRTPYKKEMHALQAMFFARRGDVYAAQDCRGRFGSPGVWEPWVNEAHDGYDSIEWLADQEYSTGKVGMIGASYLGFAQWTAASQHPPHLVTMIPNVSPPDPLHNIPYEYGVFFLWGSLWWL